MGYETKRVDVLSSVVVICMCMYLHNGNKAFPCSHACSGPSVGLNNHE